LIGLYGVAPDVAIQLPRFDRPIERLAFFLSTYGKSDGMKHLITLEAWAPNASVVVPRAEAGPTDEAPPPGTPFRMAFIFTGTQLMIPMPGLYQIIVRADGEHHFSTTFSVISA